MSHSAKALNYCEKYGGKQTSLALDAEDENGCDENEHHLKGHNNRLSH